MSFRHGNLSSAAMLDHMRAAAARFAPDPCIHCEAVGPCSCGQEEAAAVLAQAAALPLPRGTYDANRVASAMTSALGATAPFTRSHLYTLVSAVEGLASHYRPFAASVAQAAACKVVADAARAATAKLPQPQ